MIRLIIIRHGNTFASGESPRRVGARTDLALVDSGMAQARALGQHFKKLNIIPNAIFSSELNRTYQSAELIVQELGVTLSIQPKSMFNEIDYGPDENKLENEVINRIGKEALKLWDEKAIVPEGWAFDPEQTKKDWVTFAKSLTKTDTDQTVIVVTSNGIARFAPFITDGYQNFQKNYDIKLKTGTYGELIYQENHWHVICWGTKPVSRI